MITELVGPAGIGKTQTCLMMAAQVKSGKSSFLAALVVDLACCQECSRTILYCTGLSAGQPSPLNFSPTFRARILNARVAEVFFSLNIPIRTPPLMN